MRLFVTGTRGIPNIPGGVEKHCEMLYPLIYKEGHEVIISRRSTYVDDNLSEWSGIKLIDVYAPKIRSLEAITHTFLSILIAKRYKVDIVHIHAVGPALLIPLARLLGLKVVFTNHGPDYDRQKWGAIAKWMLRTGEYLGCKFANEIIVISELIKDIVKSRTGRDSTLIYNGIPVPEITNSIDYLQSLNVKPRKYLLAVARLVPEKGLHDLIYAFERMDTDWKFVIAGDTDHRDAYSERLKSSAARNRNIIMPGYVTGEKLAQLFTNAGLFVLPSYHEGLPIALLEALSYGLDVVVSDIPANKEVNLSERHYFRCGDTDDLSNKIIFSMEHPLDQTHKTDFANMINEKYDWQNIAQQTINVYARLLTN